VDQTHIELMSVIGSVAQRGWCAATSGNFSARLTASPLRMLMSPSGVDKTLLRVGDLIEVSEKCQVLSGAGKPSAESLLHVAVYEEKGVGSVLHVHSVWNTLASLKFLSKGYLELGGFEFMKAFEGIDTHECSVRIPVFENSQDMNDLSRKVRIVLRSDPQIKAFLLAGHGVYTWGSTASAAFRHLEALEFLFEVVSRNGM